MDRVYNYIAQESATELHGRRANNLPQGRMPPSQRLKAIRTRSGLSVRDVANFLNFDVHSRYSYYESPRFKGVLPLELARQLAGIFAPRGIPPEETLTLAGLGTSEANNEATKIEAVSVKERPFRVMMEVNLPNEASLTRMFDHLLQSAGVDDPEGDVAQTLALLLPGALAGTAIEGGGPNLDPDFRPVLEARSRERAKARRRLPPA